MVSILQVNTLGPFAGNDISIEAAKTITGPASQFKITGGNAGDSLLTDGAGGLSFGVPPASSTGDFGTGGNTAGADRTLGNNDAFAVGIETNNINRLNITADGFPQITGGIGANNGTVGTTVSTPASYNMLSAGPMVIDSGVTVTIGSGGHWTVV